MLANNPCYINNTIIQLLKFKFKDTEDNSLKGSVEKIIRCLEKESPTGLISENYCTDKFAEYLESLGVDPLNIISMIPERYYVRSQVEKILLIPDNIIKIGAYAYANCDCISDKAFEVKLPSKLEIIEEGAFKSSSIKTINIPNSCYYIGSNAFAECENIIIKKKENFYYVDKWIIDYRGIREGILTIPEGTKGIATDALHGYPFEEIILPQGILGVCRNISGVEHVKINIPKSVKYLDKCFADYPEITYESNKEDWKELTSFSGWNDCNTRINEVVCNDGILIWSKNSRGYFWADAD